MLDRRAPAGSSTRSARAASPTSRPLRYTALSAACGTLTILAVTAIVALTGAEQLPSAGDWRAVWCADRSTSSSLGAVVGVLAWNEGVRRIGAANGALFINLVPVVTFAIAIGQGYRPGASS